MHTERIATAGSGSRRVEIRLLVLVYLYGRVPCSLAKERMPWKAAMQLRAETRDKICGRDVFKTRYNRGEPRWLSGMCFVFRMTVQTWILWSETL